MDAATTILSMMHVINWPPHANVSDGAYFDFIVIGTGAGSIVGSRLSENSNTTVLLIEAGTYPSANALLPSTYAYVQGTAEDWNYTSIEEPTTVLQSEGVYQLSSGKVLGGSSSSNHLIQLRGAQKDFDDWAVYLDDDTWAYENILAYFKKIETVMDADVVASGPDYCGTTGPIKISSQRRNITHGYLESCEEIGLPWRMDLNQEHSTGCAESTYTMGDGLRQSTAYGYLNNLTRSNLYLQLETTAQKILFEDKVAKGVTLKLANGEIITVYANKEIIVSAGGFGSPKLLLQSGVGPKEELEALDIEVIIDSPVGKEMQDHYAVLLVNKMETTTEASEALALTDYPFPIVLMSAALDSSQAYSDYIVLGLLMAQDTTYTNVVCSTLFTFKDEICSAIDTSVSGRNQFTALISPGKGESKGYVALKSANPEDDLMIKENFYTDSEGKDLENMKKYIRHFLTMYNTTYFNKVDAEIADHGLTSYCGTTDYSNDTFLECMIKSMTVHLYHPSGTCGMGRVTNSNGEIYGLENIRVVDVSIMPNITRANTMAATMMIAEKISDVIKAKYNLVEDIDDSSVSEDSESKTSESTDDEEATEEESSNSSSDSTATEDSETSETSDTSESKTSESTDEEEATEEESSSSDDSSDSSSSSSGLIGKVVDKVVDKVTGIVSILG